ncbi:MAG: hypothetical protein P1U89_27765 [Verrucomicrobiales bacterium]|nr:hypothetical protein [Verrucomicrobiales bacterium]MDF1756613.1 hypothetical protein [Verrucomicrobiales bacterium]
MKLFYSIVAVAFLGTFAHADANHEIIEKVMKEGLKGDDSPLAKTLDGAATAEEIKTLHDLIATLKGTTAPVGDQAGYDAKVKALIEAAEKVAGGSKDEAALNTLEEASNCKACHSDHKPKKK